MGEGVAGWDGSKRTKMPRGQESVKLKWLLYRKEKLGGGGGGTEAQPLGGRGFGDRVG